MLAYQDLCPPDGPPLSPKSPLGKLDPDREIEFAFEIWDSENQKLTAKTPCVQVWQEPNLFLLSCFGQKRDWWSRQTAYNTEIPIPDVKDASRKKLVSSSEYVELYRETTPRRKMHPVTFPLDAQWQATPWPTLRRKAWIYECKIAYYQTMTDSDPVFVQSMDEYGDTLLDPDFSYNIQHELNRAG